SAKVASNQRQEQAHADRRGQRGKQQEERRQHEQPAPFGPSRQTRDPVPTDQLTLFKATLPLRDCLVTDWNEIASATARQRTRGLDQSPVVGLLSSPLMGPLPSTWSVAAPSRRRARRRAPARSAWPGR